MTTAQAEQFAFLHWQRRTDPPYYVNSTAISANGERVVAGTFFHVYAPQMPMPPVPATALPNEYGTYCFNRDGEQLWADKFQGYEGVYAVAISGQGNIAASGGWYSSSPFQGFVRIYDVDNGPANLVDFRLSERVNALAVSSDGSSVAAGADKVYLFQATNGVYPTTPAEFTLMNPPAESTAPNSAQAISMTSDGQWILVGDYYGNVYLIATAKGSFQKPFVWNDRAAMSTIHALAMTPDGQWFAAAGSGSTVYVFSQNSMTMGPPTTAGSFAVDTGGRIGWLAITDDGQKLTAIGNKGTGGAVVAIKNDAGALSKIWESPTPHNPNSTSMDASGDFVTVADGYPDGKPGSFSLFNGKTGDLVWRYPTSNMNWPMFISADASGIVAGSDDGNVFYFTPHETKQI